MQPVISPVLRQILRVIDRRQSKFAVEECMGLQAIRHDFRWLGLDKSLLSETHRTRTLWRRCQNMVSKTLDIEGHGTHNSPRFHHTAMHGLWELAPDKRSKFGLRERKPGVDSRWDTCSNGGIRSMKGQSRMRIPNNQKLAARWHLR